MLYCRRPPNMLHFGGNPFVVDETDLSIIYCSPDAVENGPAK